MSGPLNARLLPSAKVAEEVYLERKRQIFEEGHDPDHDDQHHRDGELSAAAAIYASGASLQAGDGSLSMSDFSQLKDMVYREGELLEWPFGYDELKLEIDPRRNLVKAAALIIAEIERIDRQRKSIKK